MWPALRRCRAGATGSTFPGTACWIRTASKSALILPIDTNLAVGGIYTNVVNVSVPGVPAGDYFVLLDADGDHFFNEPNFANNVLAQPVQIVNPDLTPTYFNAPTSLAVTQLNQSFPVDWTVLNQGAGSAFVSWSDCVFLSPTNVLDTNAVQIGCNGMYAGLCPRANRKWIWPPLPAELHFGQLLSNSKR